MSLVRPADLVRSLNATSSGATLLFEEPAVDFARFDRLPAELRSAIAESPTKLSAKAFQEHAAWADRQGLGPFATIRRLWEMERNEIAVFAGEYRGRYGEVLPHIAADASILRYGERGPSKHPPRVIGKGRRKAR